MIVVKHYNELCGMANDLVHADYGYSVLDEPSPAEQFDLDSHIKMFSDWGWGKSNERKPDWMD